MSTFYLVLYIFIAIILLLCLVSFGMYLCHMFKRTKSEDEYDEEILTQQHGGQAVGVHTPLNQTELIDDDADGGSGINITTHRISKRQPREEKKVEQIQLINVKKKAQLYEQQHEQHQTPSQAPPNAPTHTSKPPVPVKPLIHSQAYSVRNSVVKPSEPPPPPPPDAVVRRTSFKKPKAPPPPPPATTSGDNGDNSIYENVSNMTSNDIHPPTYDRVVSGSDYFSDR